MLFLSHQSDTWHDVSFGCVCVCLVGAVRVRVPQGGLVGLGWAGLPSAPLFLCRCVFGTCLCVVPPQLSLAPWCQCRPFSSSLPTLWRAVPLLSCCLLSPPSLLCWAFRSSQQYRKFRPWLLSLCGVGIFLASSSCTFVYFLCDGALGGAVAAVAPFVWVWVSVLDLQTHSPGHSCERDAGWQVCVSEDCVLPASTACTAVCQPLFVFESKRLGGVAPPPPSLFSHHPVAIAFREH